jgi:hypothetical protein
MTDVQSRRLQATALCRSVGPSQTSPTKFARDLQERLGILALLALSAPFRMCKLQILLVARETDPVSGHHFINNLQPPRTAITVNSRAFD